MPATLSYPGVYIEEVPSGVRAITGVATSVTAFVGRTPRGPVEDPVQVSSFGEFERLFGGLHVDHPLTYAVRDFYLNGGNQALVVRLHRNATAAEIEITVGPDTLTLVAANPGMWANDLSVRVDHQTKDADEPSPDSNLFNVTILDGDTEVERHLNVSASEDDPRFVSRVLRQASMFLRVDGAVPGRPAPGDFPTTTDGANGDPLDTPTYEGSLDDKTGLHALEKADLFNLLSIPPDERDGDTPPPVYQTALAYCVRRRAVLLVDPPAAWTANPATAAETAKNQLGTLGLTGSDATNAALYFPRVIQADPGRDGQLQTFPPSGLVAGVIARTDAQRGVWKAPAGLDASLGGIQGLNVNLTDDDNGKLNPLGINCLRSFPVTGRVVWGARTLRGADALASEWKYLPVRRLALFLEESLYRGTQWVVFEPNDEPLWSQIRLNIGAFMQNLFRQGAFQGATPREAYFVKCDGETTTQADIDLGIVNVLVGFAPLKPAEFVVIKIQQMAGQTA
ncbi:MAG TPA: phage tail sheath C-terminal domain-containing protein [Actinomycetota bacterium]|nr:phage tail sheath C-terminal domain-containing protein [Actinomycetota bacterium]